MAKQIVLDNREWIEIVDSSGNVTGGFFWNPADLDIVKRYENVAKEFESMQMPEGNDAEAVYEFSKKIEQQFDYLLNTDAAKVLFGGANPLSPRPDGTLLCEYVLNVIAQFVEKELDVRIRKTSAKIKKYTEKYKK
nr:MAG TPA: tail assembly chaperone [Bacteriophage sp.]